MRESGQIVAEALEAGAFEDGAHRRATFIESVSFDMLYGTSAWQWG
jgi:hypothetical protein